MSDKRYAKVYHNPEALGRKSMSVNQLVSQLTKDGFEPTADNSKGHIEDQ